MKKLVWVLLLAGMSLWANEIQWAADFQSGIKKAQQQNKPVLFVFSRHSCKYCVILEKTTFANDQVIKALNENFVSIIAYSDEGDKFPQYLWRPATPTLWFLKPNGEPIYQPLVGAVGEKYLLEALKVVKNEYNLQKNKAK